MQQPDLWSSYCRTKLEIAQKYKFNLENHDSSQYIAKMPFLTPLLDKTTNEYYFFHGCAPDIIEAICSGGFNERFADALGMFGGNRWGQCHWPNEPLVVFFFLRVIIPFRIQFYLILVVPVQTNKLPYKQTAKPVNPYNSKKRFA